MAGKSLSSTDRKELERVAKDRAADCRRELGLGIEPIGDIFDLLEREGLILLRYPSESDKLSAFMTVDGPDTLIYLNSKMSLGRQIFSAAHEYCHVRYDKQNLKIVSCIPGQKQVDPVEMVADSFAGAFLMPEEGLRRVFNQLFRIKPKKLNPDHVILMQYTFRVSYAAMLYNMLKADLITGGTYRYLANFGTTENEEQLRSLVRRLGFSTDLIDSNPEIPPIPRRFLQMVTANYDDGKISFGKLTSLLAIWDKSPADFAITIDYGLDD